MRKALDGEKIWYTMSIFPFSLTIWRFGADQEALYDLQNDEEQKKDATQSVWLDEDG